MAPFVPQLTCQCNLSSEMQPVGFKFKYIVTLPFTQLLLALLVRLSIYLFVPRYTGQYGYFEVGSIESQCTLSAVQADSLTLSCMFISIVCNP
jgi:hypothetical protein